MRYTLEPKVIDNFVHHKGRIMDSVRVGVVGWF